MVFQADTATILTPDEFLCSHENEHSELVRGRVRMMVPAGAPHGVVSANVCCLLTSHVRKHRLGACFGDSTGYALPNLTNTVRVPDCSFVRAERLPVEGVSGGFLQLAPDLAVEVLSPSESASDLSEKLTDYRAAGTPLVWVIDQVRRKVAVYVDDAPVAWLGVEQRLTGGTVVPGFECGVDELFEGLAPS